MGLLGVHLTLLAGTALPLPLGPDLITRLKSVTVTECDGARSAFTIVLDAGRSGSAAAFDTPVLAASPLRANARVVVILTMGAVPQILMDGIVTETELVPGSDTAHAEVRFTGHDVSILLDLHELSVEHVALEDSLQVQKIALPYLTQGIVAQVIPPPVLDPPLPIERIPTQQATDYIHIQDLATFHGYVSYMIPGPAPGTSTLYWGPPVRVGLPQPTLSVDLGPSTNVTGSPRFREDVLEPELLEGQVADPRLGEVVPIRTIGSLRPPLAALPVWVMHQTNLRSRQFRDSGISATTAFGRAQGQTDLSMDCVIAEGTLDGGAYGSILRPRGLVGMRGAGWSNDGLWYVRQVVHHVSPGSYAADFTLAREGYGATVPVVRV